MTNIRELMHALLEAQAAVLRGDESGEVDASQNVEDVLSEYIDHRVDNRVANLRVR